MKKLIMSSLLICSGLMHGQVKDAEAKLKNATKTDTIKSWKRGALFNFGFNQVTLSNWAAGGNNSISCNGVASFYLNYIGKKSSWENNLVSGYGIMKQNRESIQKTDDNIELTSTFGKKATQHWFYSGLINFKNQFTDGFNYPNDTIKISSFLAPGYLLGAAGMNYKFKEFLTIFVSPITSKTTFVMDENLSKNGAFGVEPDKKIRNEVGGYLRCNFQREVMKNIKMISSLGLFSNYIKNPQNIDLNWDFILLMKVNKFITATINTNLIYDDDITITQDKNSDGINEVNGPRVQFKEIMGVGFSYKL